MNNQNNPEMRACPHCRKEISVSATKCPFCQSDLRAWIERHVFLTVLLVGLALLFFISVMTNPNWGMPQGSSGSSQTDAIRSPLSLNTPTIKQIATVPADYVGQNFVLSVNAEASTYYNYGFSDESQYYSIRIWDDSVRYDNEGIYAYMPKNTQNKILFDSLIEGNKVLRVHTSIPTRKYEKGSNSYMLIQSWELGQ